MKQILANNPNFTSDFTEDAKDLIQNCLNIDPDKRPCWKTIKEHQFF